MGVSNIAAGTLVSFVKQVLLGSLLAACAWAQDPTVIDDRAAASMLLGKHMFSLQWISWDYFGAVNVTNDRGIYRIKGEQKGRGNSDIVTIDGVITSIGEKEFGFDGTIVTRVSHINNGEDCRREGKFTFRITGKRKYWRLQQMDNPCDEATDYVDIYFK